MSGSNRARQPIDPTLDAAPLLTRIKFDNVRETPYVPPPGKPLPYLPWLVLLLVILLGLVIYQESEKHFYQSRFWHSYAKQLSFELNDGPSQSIVFPANGPFDERFGYHQLPLWSDQLKGAGFTITKQSSFSEPLQRYTEYGFYPPYNEKTQTGLQIFGCQNDSLFSAKWPAFQFVRLNDVAPLIVNSLLFIEDRTLLSPEHPDANPVLNVPRLGAAVISQIQRAVGIDAPAAGGSTLATQIEKYRHTPQGFTTDITDKFRQLVSASVRAYSNATNTIDARRQLALDYINTVPLAATSAHGEVHGLGDGLQAWFAADPASVNRLLKQPAPHSIEQAVALRQVIALFIAQRRPSYYLLQGRKDLEQLVSSHLILLQRNSIVPPALAELAQAQKLTFNSKADSHTVSPQAFKAATMVRSRLASLLQQSFYQLDRLDLSSQTTLDAQLQRAISRHLNALKLPEPAAEAGLFGDKLLKEGQQSQLRYSFTLYQRTPTGNKVRVQTDNTDQPFDLNESSKLELGSTAKLRVLVSYLEIIAELHQLYAEEAPETLRYLTIAPQDHLTAWAISYLIAQPGADLTSMLDAAMQRRYSADPKESFFTGGGLHTFNNFRKEENELNPTIAEALEQSVNLPFVRLLQDVISYSIYHGQNSSYQLLLNDDDPRRDQYLRRFADKEGITFLNRFWQKYKNSTPQQRFELFRRTTRQTPERLAAAYLYIYPDSTVSDFSDAMTNAFPATETTQSWENLYHKYYGNSFDLPERAYLARSHPLELWLLAFLQQQPAASLTDVIQNSAEQRQQVYQWLFKTRFRSARDQRISTMLEIEAFWDLHQRWQRLGYPFDYLVPSLATALGSSGDRPAALADLIGIILNDGKKLPTHRIDNLHFAQHTPYETVFSRPAITEKQVLPAEVAATVKKALQQVVQQGTARRLQLGYDTTTLAIGGKTGTGDNRIVQANSAGKTISSTAANRTATFAFYIGEQHFGVLTAYIPGEAAEQFKFTSALPLQVLNSMSAVIQPYLTDEVRCH